MQDAMLRQVAASTAGTGPGLSPEHCCWLQVGDWTEASTAVRHDSCRAREVCCDGTATAAGQACVTGS